MPARVDFVDTDGDTIAFMRESGGINYYVNGKLKVGNLTTLWADERGRIHVDGTSAGAWSAVRRTTPKDRGVLEHVRDLANGGSGDLGAVEFSYKADSAAEVVIVSMRRRGVWWNFMDDDRWARLHVMAKPKKMPPALAPYFTADEYCKMLLEIDARFKARADCEMCLFNFLCAITLLFILFLLLPWSNFDGSTLKRETDAILAKHCAEKGLKAELCWPRHEQDAIGESRAVSGNELRFTLPSAPA